MNRSSALRLALLCAVPLLLGSCETLKSINFNPKPPAPPPCPRAVIGDNVGRLTRFSGADKDPANVVFEVEVGDLTGSCVYNDNNIEVDMRVQLFATRGPAAKDGNAKFNYFVAVARTDKTILSRDSFDTEIELTADKPRNETADDIEQTIPIKEGQSGADLVIVVGLVMTPDELEYNRKRGR